jgi:hypothetical protein
MQGGALGHFYRELTRRRLPGCGDRTGGLGGDGIKGEGFLSNITTWIYSPGN